MDTVDSLRAKARYCIEMMIIEQDHNQFWAANYWYWHSYAVGLASR